jgi:alanine racemase
MEIDLRKIKANIEKIKQSTNKDIIVVVKSNAYSLNDIEVTKYLEEIKIKYVAVVDTVEAMRLLQNGIKMNILILNSIDSSWYPSLALYPNLIVSINSIEEAISFSNYNFSSLVKVHIQIDTGMNRLGFKEKAEYLKALALLKTNPNIMIEGIYTHFTDSNNYENQENIFKNYSLEYPYQIIHLAASSTFLKSQIGNFVRVGLFVYGDSTNQSMQSLKVACKPLKIFDLKKGEKLGYDQDYVALEDEKIALLPIGYFNGYRRSLRGFFVLCEHKRYQTVGKICMNHLFVKIDSTPTMNSEFIITNEELSIFEMAEYLKTVPHEILCMMNISDKRYIR